MFKLEEIKKFHAIYNQFQDTIDQIIEFNNEINDKNDEIRNIRATYDGFIVEVQQWAGGGFWDSEEIRIPFDLLTNEKYYRALEEQAEAIKNERLRLAEERENEITNKKIVEAMKLLKDHGKI